MWIYFYSQKSSWRTSLICIVSTIFWLFQNIVQNILGQHRLNIASLRIGKHCIVKNIASLRKVNIAHPYQRVALPEKINESSWILKQKVSQITYLTYEAGLVSISLKSLLVFDELKLSWRHDGSKNSTPNPALISARPSVKWQLFSYKEENQSKKSKLNTLHHKVTIEFESFNKR